ncbi:MAG: hypothetical protein IJQ32_05520 [Paludibacteraceae bacterium]|nr:hypothetical protein [Paludibacteraceae bacterium]
MTAKTFLLIVLSCLLVVGCKKSEEKNEPTPPEPTFTKITEDQLKSYFPYTVGKRLAFESEESTADLYYTIKEVKFTNNSNKMELFVSMKEEGVHTTGLSYQVIEMKTIVTDSKILKTEFTNYRIYSSSKVWETTGSYTYDASKNDSLPEKIVLSNGAIIQKDKGLVYYEDHDSYKWYFWAFLQ